MTEKEVLKKQVDIKDPCLSCKHARPISGGCKAFPNGIPYKFSSGEEFHNSIEPDQIGDFVFEEGESDEFKDYGM